MDEFSSKWIYQENIDDLRQKLLCTTFELDSLKVQANEEMTKHKLYVEQLIELLKIAYRERDETKLLLQKLLNKFIIVASPTELQPVLVEHQPGSPMLVPVIANSSITESSSLSDTYNHHSHGSSPVDSFLDGVASPDFSGINMADSSQMGYMNKPFLREYNVCNSGCLVSAVAAKADPADAVIDNLVKGKVLPQKGKLLSTLMEAGPLLQTLLVAGPLPRWRNPPPLQPLKIPPVLIKGCETTISKQKPVPSVGAGFAPHSDKPMTPHSHVEISCGSSQMCSASLLNSRRVDCDSGLGNGLSIKSDVISQIPAGKRQRFH